MIIPPRLRHLAKNGGEMGFRGGGWEKNFGVHRAPFLCMNQILTPPPPRIVPRSAPGGGGGQKN